MTQDSYVHHSLCANCQQPGTATCAGCRLVTYCDKQCQSVHWSTHKTDCRSPLRAKTWQPRWVVEQREPRWAVTKDVPSSQAQYLWGNMVALDILQLKNNEGETYAEDLKLLFAASGDPRNVLKTLADMPPSYEGRLSVTMNDYDQHVVARNAIILLLMVTVDNIEVVSECILHIWYSAFIRQVDLDLINRHVLPPIQEICAMLEGKSAVSLHSVKWRIGRCTLRFTLAKAAWHMLLACLTVRPELTFEDAQQMRLAVVNRPEHQDSHDHTVIKMPPEYRPCKKKFREDGIVLPFGHSRETFVIPNPTLFRASTWPIGRGEDPITSWDPAQVMSTHCGNATNDLTGKLHCHIRSHIWSAHQYLSRKGADLELFNLDAAKLSTVLPQSVFARIETSNLGDLYFLGPAATVGCLSPFLQARNVNPFATLITFFLGAVMDARHLRTPDPVLESQNLQDGYSRLRQYQVMADMFKKREAYRPIVASALGYALDHESSFAVYYQSMDFQQTASQNGLNIKTQNTITEKWPFKLKLKKGDPGFDEEFNALFASGHWGPETYVEWAKAD